MKQASLSQRFEKIKARCLKVPGGIKAVAAETGVSQNTLHNWFNGVTTPRVEDVERMKQKLEMLEEKGEAQKKEKEDRLNAALA